MDPEPVAGSGTHLGGVVTKARAKVKHNNDSEKVTVDALSRREQMGRWLEHKQVQLFLGHTQGASMRVHTGTDLELYS